MGLKKYEIITVGNDKRVRALRSWQVGDRYVNIGDVGGIVYDEKTLSQDGACWLFRGNFGFPGARIGGDSIVDVGEATLSATGTPNVDILGSSVVVGSKLQFGSRQTAADAVTLTAADFEQGTIDTPVVGSPINKLNSSSYVRSKNPIFLGGNTLSIGAAVEGYRLRAIVVDRDEVITGSTAFKVSGTGVTLTAPAGQYTYIVLSKDPVAVTAPADAAAAQITFTGTYETKLSIVDSRVEINPATSTGTLSLRPGGTYTMTPGAKYPDSVIQNSKVSMMVHATANRTITLMAEFINTNASIDASVELAPAVPGIYKNVKNLAFSGSITGDARVGSRGVIQATDCDNFAVSTTIFPGLATAQTANMPFIFQGCNVPNGIFYHHVQIKNTYKNIDFALAQADLGKLTPGGPLVSSEVEGMYRLFRPDVSVFGGLVESYESVKDLNMASTNNITKSYNTTVYADAYLKGKIMFEGTNVFGNKVRSHPLAQVLNVQPRAVQGNFNASNVGGIITGVITDNRFCVIPTPFRVNGTNGIMVQGVSENINVTGFFVTVTGLITTTASITGSPIPSNRLPEILVYVRFSKAGGGAITPEDLAGVTVTVYNGCKIVNTGTTEVIMKGNIRVEDNAALINASIAGSGYFGGNSVVYYNPTVWASLDFNGTVYMRDNAVFAPSALTGASALVRMEGNAKFTGSVDVASTNLSLIMRDNAVIEGKANTRSGVVMSGNSKVTATGQITAASRGVLVMEENASIEASTTVIGAITLSGNYKGNAVRTWTGKRTITDVNAPEYDNNVKTQYDF